MKACEPQNKHMDQGCKIPRRALRSSDKKDDLYHAMDSHAGVIMYQIMLHFEAHCQ